MLNFTKRKLSLHLLDFWLSFYNYFACYKLFWPKKSFLSINLTIILSDKTISCLAAVLCDFTGVPASIPDLLEPGEGQHSLRRGNRLHGHQGGGQKVHPTRIITIGNVADLAPFWPYPDGSFQNVYIWIRPNQVKVSFRPKTKFTLFWCYCLFKWKRI